MYVEAGRGKRDKERYRRGRGEERKDRRERKI
jgi:hypothetical protein